MGNSGTRMLHKIFYPYGRNNGSGEGVNESSEKMKMAVSPFVYTFMGTRYYDEDGDLAHEFYIEVVPKGKRKRPFMRRIQENLRPEGEVTYRYPRIHVELPVVIYSDVC